MASSPKPGTRSPIRAAVMRIATVLLYRAGPRRGELLRLSLDDVNVNGGVLGIHNSKSHKSRWVPPSRSAVHELRSYLAARREAEKSLMPTAVTYFENGTFCNECAPRPSRGAGWVDRMP